MTPPNPAAARGGGRSGILLIDKPAGLTSHGVVARVRRLAGTRKVGHAGTLDPMATGLLIVGLNAATRLLTYMVGLDKAYRATIRLGAATTTDDADGEITHLAPPPRVAAIAPADIDRELAALTGELQQVPSSYSAVKVDGRRAYERARSGEQVELRPRTVTVSALELLSSRRSAEGIELQVTVECSSGTYVRALARDLGTALGVGGHLTALRRTRIGPFELASAAELEGLDVAGRLISPADAAGRLFESIRLSEDEAVDLRHGKQLAVGRPADGPLAAVAPDGTLVGLVSVREGRARTLVGFPPDEPDETDAPDGQDRETQA